MEIIQKKRQIFTQENKVKDNYSYNYKKPDIVFGLFYVYKFIKRTRFFLVILQ